MKNVVKRNCGKQVEYKSSSYVAVSNNLQIWDFVACNWMVKSCSEVNEDIHSEANIYDCVKYQKFSGI